MLELFDIEKHCSCGGEYEIIDYSVDTAINWWTSNPCETESMKYKCNKCGHVYGRTVFNESLGDGSLEERCKNLPCYVRPEFYDRDDEKELMQPKRKSKRDRLL